MFDTGEPEAPAHDADDAAAWRPPDADLPAPEPPPYRDQWSARAAALVDELAATAPELVDHAEDDGRDTISGHAPGDAAVLARLRELGRLIDRLEAERATLLHDADATGVLGRDGAATAATWLRRTTTLTASQAAARARIAHRLPDLPEIADAARAGMLGVAHLTHIDRLCRDTGTDNVAAIQTPLLVAADRLRDVAEFTKLCTGWRHALAPDHLDRRDDRNYDRRSAAIAATLDGVVHGHLRLDAEGGAAVLTAVNALITHDDPDTPADQRRTRDQKVADAVVELATLHLRAGTLPDVAGERPHVTIRVDAATALGHPGAPPAEIDGIGPVGAATARRLMDDATYTRVVYDADGQPIDVGTATRKWPTGTRRAITDRDRRCRFPGCTLPPPRCDIDHVDPVEDHGPTRVRNGILLCRYHHRQKRPDNWWPTLHPHGGVTWNHPTLTPRYDPPAAHHRDWITWLTNQAESNTDTEPPPDTAGEDRARYNAGRATLVETGMAERCSPTASPRNPAGSRSSVAGGGQVKGRRRPARLRMRCRP